MILGVDPGAHGALVLYDPASHSVCWAQNIPVLTLLRNGKNKTSLNLAALVATIKEIAPRVKHAFLELVGPMPKQGVSSVWAFSRCDTALETAVVAAGIPYTRVSPAVWKKATGTPADKDGALARASQLLPASASYWTPKRGTITKEDAIGVAEAGLIAHYGAQQKFLLTHRCAQT